jgi:hypothetical protein
MHKLHLRINFPVLESCMFQWLTYRKRGMQMEVYPYLAEYFHNHGGTVIKCYVIDDQVFIRAKPSLPDIIKSVNRSEIRNICHDSQDSHPVIAAQNLNTCSSGNGEMAFHTLQNMPCVTAEFVNTALAEDELTIEAAQRCARVIRKATDLSLFGFDLIAPTDGDGFILVDVNAFPSFKGVEGAADALREFVQHRCKRSFGLFAA